MNEVGEYYMVHREIAERLRRQNRWVLERIRNGDFGTEVIEDAGDYMVPLSAFNAFVRARRVFDDNGQLKSVYARTADELKKKLAGLRQNQCSKR